MEEHGEVGAARRSSSRVCKVAPKAGIALHDTIMRAQAAAARLEALEKDPTLYEAIDIEDDDEACMDEDERPAQKWTSKGSKWKTRQARALELVSSTKKAPRGFLDLLQEAKLESLPSNAPSYLHAAVGPPRVGACRHFCSVCCNVATLPRTLVHIYVALDVKCCILTPIVRNFWHNFLVSFVTS